MASTSPRKRAVLGEIKNSPMKRSLQTTSMVGENSVLSPSKKLKTGPTALRSGHTAIFGKENGVARPQSASTFESRPATIETTSTAWPSTQETSVDAELELRSDAASRTPSPLLRPSQDSFTSSIGALGSFTSSSMHLSSTSLRTASPERVSEAAKALKLRLGVAMYKVRARRPEVPYRTMSIPLHCRQLSLGNGFPTAARGRGRSLERGASSPSLPRPSRIGQDDTPQRSSSLYEEAWHERTPTQQNSRQIVASQSLHESRNLGSNLGRKDIDRLPALQLVRAFDRTAGAASTARPVHGRRGSDPAPILPPIQSIVGSGLLQRL